MKARDQTNTRAPAPATAEAGLPALDFQQVYDAHFALVWRTLQRFGVPERDLADASQDVFVAVHQGLPAFEGRSRLSTWLFRICFHIASSRARRAHVRREVMVESYLQERAPDPGADQRLQQQRDLELLGAILAEMDLDCRAVFCLFELEDLTGAEIAELLSVPIGTVYSRLRTARAVIERRFRRLEQVPFRTRRIKEGA